VTDLERAGHGVIMTMGKGGVGKTTVAAAIASALAQRGHKFYYPPLILLHTLLRRLKIQSQV